MNMNAVLSEYLIVIEFGRQSPNLAIQNNNLFVHSVGFLLELYCDSITIP